MSTPSPAPKTDQKPDDPPPNPYAPTFKPPADAIKVSTLVFVSKNLPITGINSSNEKLTSRTSDRTVGIDIYFLPSLRVFRAEKFGPDVGKDDKPHMIHESRVEFWRPA